MYHRLGVENKIDKPMEKEEMIYTGFSAIDSVTGGLKPSELVVVAGRPSAGKTSLAISIAKNVAVDQNIPTAFLTLEMNNVRLTDLLISNACNIRAGKLLRGQLNSKDWDRLDDNIKYLQDSPIYIDDTPSPTLEQIEDKIRHFVIEHGTRLVVIDHLGLLNIPNVRDRQLELAVALHYLKRVALDLQVVIIAVSMLASGVDLAKKTPQTSDYEEFNAIGRYADRGILIYRPEKYRLGHIANENSVKYCGCIVITKRGTTNTSEAILKFNWESRRFENCC